jgi:hypothetical protein
MEPYELMGQVSIELLMCLRSAERIPFMSYLITRSALKTLV